MNEQKQLESFWQWCGLKYEVRGLDIDEPESAYRGWYDANDKLVTFKKDGPTVTLDNLFKYAVPAIVQHLSKTMPINWARGRVKNILIQWMADWSLGQDPAIALYNAICKVMEREKAQ